MKSNNEVRKQLDHFYIGNCKKITLEISCEKVYFIFLDGKMVHNSLDKEITMAKFSEYKRRKGV